jgi:hypothetical protein
MQFRWTVDLEHDIFVTSVRITNRAFCCWENLKNFDVRVGDSLTDNGRRNPQCGETYSDVVGEGETLSINCVPPLLGRYVTISIENTEGTLNFCEVEVYGYQRKSQPRTQVLDPRSPRRGKNDPPLGERGSRPWVRGCVSHLSGHSACSVRSDLARVTYIKS